MSDSKLIKQRGNRYWIAAPSELAALTYAAQFGTVSSSHWAGPGHYRSDVYIIETEIETAYQKRMRAITRARTEAQQAENRRAAVAVYGDTSTETYRQLCRDAENAYNDLMELVHNVQ